MSRLAARTGDATPPARGGWTALADLGCLGLGLALAVSASRVLEAPDSVAALSAVAFTGWALATLLRMSRVRAVLAEVGYLAVGALAALWLAAPDERWGPLPAPGSLAVIADAVRDDFSTFARDVAPIEMGTGHLIVLGSLVWLLALFVSTGAMRLRTPVQAAIPHVAAIVALGIVSREVARTATTVALLCALALYVVSQAMWRNAALRWSPNVARGRRAPLLGAIGIVVAAGAITAATVALLPVTSSPVVDLRRGGTDGGPRTVVSPFVEVGSNLGARSDQLLFTVSTDTPQPSYWRLTSLEDYDPDKAYWRLSDSFKPVAGPLAEADGRETYTAVVDIAGLGGIWIPSPATPLEAESDIELRWDDSSAALITGGRDRELMSGDSITITAAPELRDSAQLEGAEPALDADAGLLDDSGVPASLSARAAELAAGRVPVQQALALQDWFRTTFTYDETIDLSSSPDPLGEFIASRRGFCQQFSTAFALAARSIGLPTRVVVGFTPGDASPADPSDPGGPTISAVRGRHAHAWPEVLFAGLGWVPFEPTPGRGDPATTALTGVPGAQAEAPAGEEEVREVPSPTTTDAPAPASVPDQEIVQEVDAGNPAAAEDESGSGGITPGLVLLAAAAGAALLWAVLSVRGRRRRERFAEKRDPIRHAWISATERLRSVDLGQEPNETPSEFSRRANESLALDGLDDLARLETERRWSQADAGPAGAAEARRALERLEESIPAGN